ncbi:chemotaxis response regulator protein-glutamate methylesterase [Anaeromyxobacter sp. Fw109-5]|uniref:protein-glutamate methylesterase/protein-glutamine glutaminase n=1 Tax=Anaeromyxobacter sp. (strain Fw109-5) TaxID=404589 RepID=UPI0000ED76D7|nr:chemotaxis response regulator protein-glutamate methylesterase [Anaeromyxobacter sp. Fw109-5]ABS24857.1 response regulator receiver modulated CheB methylesterase [Anaeromyxobacter sp. Fw109-5]
MPARVLVVDDSAVVRQALAQILGRAGLAVATANDPLIAMEKMRRERPDAIVLDIEMPRMDGLTFLRKLMAEDPIPVVVCSGLAGPGTEVALRALEEGAVDLVEKPRLGVKDFLEGSAGRLVHVVRAAVLARVRRRPSAPPLVQKLSADAVLPARPAARGAGDRIVVVGASTGGTEALRVLLGAMPPDAPGIAVVQHMPPVFTAQFAARLDRTCRIEVKEAAQGDRLGPGRALVAPGDRHLALRRAGDGYFVDVLDGPPVSLHRPSVNVLFRSAAQAAGGNAAGVILTGMGDDGADGLAELRAAGARTFAQDEASCVVFGMPKEAIARGAVEEVLPLPRIAPALLHWSRGPRPRESITP